MNRLALGLGVLLFFSLSANAQDTQTPGDDASAVRATVINYIEAYYTGDAARMEQTLHPHCERLFCRTKGEMMTITADEVRGSVF
jgi:hypothetical protein